jgi:5-(carboxyamino)imidazole ribonucleotide synthase
MNNLKKRIGIIGGGQLGKMMILDAKRLGFYVTTLDPASDCPSHSISDAMMIAAFDDADAIRALAEVSDVITYEFEHIHVDILKDLVAEGHAVYPTPSSLEIIQNKYTQKQALTVANLPVPDFKEVSSIDEIREIGELFGYPMMLKACLGGYDGKGNAVVKSSSQEDISSAFFALAGGKNPLMLERFVDFDKEISVLACRGLNGQVVVYPVGENEHKNSILDITLVPAQISPSCTTKAMELAEAVMDIFHGVGMFCIEMFVAKDETLYVNEVAPRPHNSGHYTIEGCLTSQFEQHIRAITGLPFGDVSLRCPTVMMNLLGDTESEGKTMVTGIEEAYKNPRVKVHLYGKAESKAHRKMGHLTVISETIEGALMEAQQAQACIKIFGGQS